MAHRESEDRLKETKIMYNLPKIALGAWVWGNDGTFGNNKS